MKCKSSERLLLEYIEGTLSPQQAGRLRIHLGKCTHCQKELEAFEKTIRLASHLRVAYPPPEVWEDFWPQLRAQIQKSQSVRKHWVPLWARVHAWRIAGAACLFVCLLSLWAVWGAGWFKVSVPADPSPFDSLIAQNFMSPISMKQLQEQLNLELQRTDATLAWGDEGSLMDEIRPQESSISSDLVNQMVRVIATQIDLEYVEDEELTDLVSSMNNRSTLAVLYK